jgi:hypothetical protein
MVRTLLTLSVTLVVLAGCQKERRTEPPPPPLAGPSTPLWNGRDLTGWVQVLDSKWVVENGALVARQNPEGRRQGESWLITEKDYQDFLLSLKFRVTPGGNSGVFLRDPVPRAERLRASDGGTPPWDAGVEANINATDPNYPTGSLWEVAKGPHDLERPGEWNEMLVKVQGNRVWVWVNGRLAVDATQSRSQRGAIGLQRHGTPQYRDKVVEFKELTIQELK